MRHSIPKSNFAGNLYHKILELYLNELKAQNLVLQIEGGVLESQLEPQYEEILEKSNKL